MSALQNGEIGPPADSMHIGGPSEPQAGGPACIVPGTSRAAVEVVGEVAVGLDPEGVAVDAEGLAYAACSRSNALSVVDLRTLEPAGAIVVGGEPIDIVYDRQTNRLFTADARSDQVSVVDVATRSVLRTVAVGSYPAGLAIDEDNRRLYCGNTMGSSVSVIDLDRLECVGTVTAELGAGAVAVAPGLGRAYCSNFMTSSVTVIDTAELEVVDRLVVGEGPCAVAVNPTSHELYVVSCLVSTVARFDITTGALLGELPVPNAPVGLAVGARGDRLYVGNRGDGTLSVLGTAGHEWARVTVGAAPGGVFVHPDEPHIVLVANAGSGSLTVVEDRQAAAPGTAPDVRRHPLVGRKLPDFTLPDLRTQRARHRREWAEKKYILNFFASW